MILLRQNSAGALGIVLIALMLAACGDSSTAPSPTPTPNPTPSPGSSGAMSISIVRGATTLTSTAYAPNPATVPVGTQVTWTNNDNTTHDSTAVDRSFSTGSIAPGASATVTLQKAGSITYYCTIHPGMTGTIQVQ